MLGGGQAVARWLAVGACPGTERGELPETFPMVSENSRGCGSTFVPTRCAYLPPIPEDYPKGRNKTGKQRNAMTTGHQIHSPLFRFCLSPTADQRGDNPAPKTTPSFLRIFIRTLQPRHMVFVTTV